ncbi:MAG: PDZ domain-containing protein [Planctomycetaceae bacterium]|nr:MAG: PDZ domain-containing protein [Planctomycetaceae bacterium]
MNRARGVFRSQQAWGPFPADRSSLLFGLVLLTAVTAAWCPRAAAEQPTDAPEQLATAAEQPTTSGADEGAPPFRLDPRILAAESGRIAAIERAMPATVSIFVPGGGGGGSGVLISPDGYALTNFHVTSPAGSFMRCGLSDGRIYNAVIIGIDPVGDLALIRLLGRDDFPYAEMADSRTARPGQWCLVIGNPFLLATNLQPTVTWGILSGVGRYQYPAGTLLEYADCLQTDASINPGNSGGPLFDDSGRLLGIVGRASFEKRGRVNVGVGYAISINQAKNFLGDLHSGRILDHATLGATVATDPDEGGARISNILRSSDAYRRGLRYGQQLLEIDGRSVNTANEVQNVLATLPAGWRVPVVYLDGRERKSTLVRLANLHGYDELLQKMAAALPPPPPTPEPSKPGPDEGPGSSPKENPADPDARPEGQPPRPLRPGRPGGGADQPLPPEVEALFEARKGFANYHPNRLKQQELLKALREPWQEMWGAPANGDEPTVEEPVQTLAPSVWTIEGVTDDPNARSVTLHVADDLYRLTIGDQVIETTRRADLAADISEKGLSGLLAALETWRTLLVRGVDGYGDCHYRGQVPLLGARPLRDCLIGVGGEYEAAWLTHPETGRLEAVEVTVDRDEDPAELLISWADGSPERPIGLELRYGTTPIFQMRVESWKVQAAEPSAEVTEVE